jgi:hypothetical protein
MKSNPFLSMIMMFILYLFLFSYKYGKLSSERILAKPNITELTLSNGEIKTGNLFGKSNGYVFLLENNNSEVNIYTITNVISIIKIK